MVNKLKSILGEESREFAALRQEAIFDIMEPILRPEPDIKRFIKNYDNFVKNNPTLAKELFPDSVNALADLRKMAPSLTKVDPLKLPFAWTRFLAVGLGGHAIARAALKVKTIEKLANVVKSIPAKSRRKRIIAEVLEYDPFAPFLPKKVPFIGAMTQSAIDQSEVDQPSLGLPFEQENP